MKHLLTFSLLLLLSVKANAQSAYGSTAVWGNYKKDSSIMSFDLQFMEMEKKPDYKCYMSVNIFKLNCDDDKFPSEEESKDIKNFNYELFDYFELKGGGVIVGLEEEKCQLSFYIYLNDTASFNTHLRKTHHEKFSKWGLSTAVKASENWRDYDVYLEPKNKTYEELYLYKMYEHLSERDDDLTKAREITHTIDFQYADQKQKKVFLDFVEERGFTYEYKSGLILWMSRIDYADPEHLNVILNEIRMKALECEMSYQGISITRLR